MDNCRLLWIKLRKLKAGTSCGRGAFCVNTVDKNEKIQAFQHGSTASDCRGASGYSAQTWMFVYLVQKGTVIKYAGKYQGIFKDWFFL